MAGILKSCAGHRNDCLVSLLVIGPADLCSVISEGLHESARQKKWKIVVHKCESIADVVKQKVDIAVDFVIFAFNLKASQSLSEVEENIGLIDEYYIISGSACLVNCESIPNVMGFAAYKSMKIRDKYNIRYLTADVTKAEARVSLGNRILNIAEAILGLNSGIPNLGCTVQYK